MSRKNSTKQYWEMTTEELRQATREFDLEFVADKAVPLSPELRERWQRAKSKHPRQRDPSKETITVRVDKSLLARFRALAKKKRLSPDALFARGLKALLGAEGEL